MLQDIPRTLGTGRSVQAWTRCAADEFAEAFGLAAEDASFGSGLPAVMRPRMKERIHVTEAAWLQRVPGGAASGLHKMRASKLYIPNLAGTSCRMNMGALE